MKSGCSPVLFDRQQQVVAANNKALVYCCWCNAEHLLKIGYAITLTCMDTTQILSAIDAEISKLQQVRSLLANSSDPEAVLAKRGPGRPKKAAEATKPVKAVKRVLSPEARKKIADAQKKRWAAAAKK